MLLNMLITSILKVVVAILMDTSPTADTFCLAVTPETQQILVNLLQFVFKDDGRLTGYSSVLVHYIHIGKLWWLEMFDK